MTEENKPFQFLHGKEIKNLSESDQLAYEQAGFVYWRQRGFPFPNPSIEELVNEYLEGSKFRFDNILSDSRKRIYQPTLIDAERYTGEKRIPGGAPKSKEVKIRKNNNGKM